MHETILRMAAYSADMANPAYRALGQYLDDAKFSVLPSYAPTLGLNKQEFSFMMKTCFPSALQEGWECPSYSTVKQENFSEFTQLVKLILSYAGTYGPETKWIAHMLACGCFGTTHLWKDLGLNGRDQVTHLIAHYFPILFEKNKEGIPWKRLLVLELRKNITSQKLHYLKPEKICIDCDKYTLCALQFI
jgi:nitrogen fixation protein NifQ